MTERPNLQVVPQESVITTDSGAPYEGSKLWQREIRGKAKSLVKMLDTGYMDLGQVLYQIFMTPGPQGGKAYVSWGYSSFDDYVALDLDTHPKKAQRLMAIHRRVVIELGDTLSAVTRARLVALGFSKLKELIRVLTPSNVEEWLTFAENASWRAIDDRVKEAVLNLYEESKARVDERKRLIELAKEANDMYEVNRLEQEIEQEIESPESFNIAMPEAQKTRTIEYVFKDTEWDSVKGALQIAEKISGIRVAGANLSLICLEYQALNGGLGSAKLQKSFFQRLETVLGIRLVALNPDKGEIAYGVDALKAFIGTAEDAEAAEAAE